ncbi:MAG: site-specific integrase [Caldilineaceae bacterium]|nr:site-specific integrase [Caldilineaceae bacterium]MCB0138503.1 site-specific integrase [Caldilineaceae bacterium]
MTRLRQRMIKDMQLCGLSENTQESYVGAVRRLAEHYNKPPDEIAEEELRQYFLHLKNEQQVSRGTSNVALCAIKFFYERTLGRSRTTLAFARPPREHKLPAILSRPEVQRLLTSIRLRRHQDCLGTIYACGLRRQEALTLQVSHIDGDRMVLHIHKGKRGRDRYVPLPQPTLEILRTWWATHRNPVWLFPAGAQAGRGTPLSP